MSRVPTEAQYDFLRMLGNGCACVTLGKRRAEMYLRRGWVTAEPPRDGDRYYSWARITPDGLRALAAAVERYGLPELGPSRVVRRWECAKCGSTRVLSRAVEVEAA